MNKLLVCGVVATLVIADAPAVAQQAQTPGVATGTAPMSMPMQAPRAPQTRVFALSTHEMTREEVSRHVAEMFAHLDKNRDGFVTRNEVEAIHEGMIGMRGNLDKRPGERWMAMPSRAASFDRLDTNHDGSLSRQ